MEITMLILIALISVGIIMFAVRAENNRIDLTKRYNGLELRIRLLEEKSHLHKPPEGGNGG